MTERIDKDSLPLDKPRRTPDHPTKSHIVKTRVDGKERIIRFGEKGASTAGKPKAGESERMKAKRASFKARHAKNIAKGKSSPAYWADKVKWASGGPVELREMYAKYSEGGSVKKDDNLRGLINSMRKMFSLDTPKDMTTGETVADIAAGFVPGLGTAQAARDFERARREGDKLGMGLAGVGMIPVVGGMVKPGKAAAKSLAEMAEQYGTKVAPQEQKMLQGVYRGYAGENIPAKTALGTDTYFVSPQKRVADYYAQRRAAETGAAPHAEMVLVDPATLRNQPYGLSIPIDKYNRDFLVTRARRVDPDEVKSRTQLYAEGGAVEAAAYDPARVDDIVNQIREGIYG